MKKLLWLLIPILVLAVPSNRKEVKTFYQPDGTPIYARLIGDEHYLFFEDMDGYVMVRNTEGWLTYAKKENGLLVPTPHIVGKSEPAYAPHLRPRAEAIAKLPRNKNKIINCLPVSEKELRGSRAVTGTKKMIVLLAAFSDSGFGWVKAGETPNANLERRHFWGLIFGDSVPPLVPDSSVYSLNNYYWEATYAKNKWIGDVDTIRVAAITRALSNEPNVDDYIAAACVAANAVVDFSQYDLDGDGDVDHLVVVHPGYGEEESGDAADIGSATYWGLPLGPYDGKTVNRASVVPENGKLGVNVHEVYHQIDETADLTPDLYDYDYDGDGVGDFCLMSSGSWNNDGRNPPHMCGLMKLEADAQWPLTRGGWLGAASVKDTAELTNCGKYFITQLDSQPGSALNYERLYMVRNTALKDSNQMFIIENRQKTGKYESYLPRSGLCIYHLDRRMALSRLNDGPPEARYYYYFQERNLFDPNRFYYLSTQIAGADTVKYSPNDYFAPFAADYGYTKFDSVYSTAYDKPNCGRNWRLNSAPSGWGPSITGISKTDYNMSFYVNRLTVPVSGPAITLSSYTIRDPITAGTNNDNNGLFNAGETDTLILTFYNSSAAGTTVQESLYTIDPYITITNPARRTISASMVYNTYANDQANPYIIQVAFNAPPNYTAQFKYKVWANAGAYTDSGDVFIPVNTTNIVWRFNPSAVTHLDFKPMAITVYNDTIFLSDGDSLPPLAGTWRIYKFSPTGALLTSAAKPGLRYTGSCDIAANGNIYWSNGDTLVQTTRALATVAPKVRHYNVNWAGAQIKRVRGVTFPPNNAPTNYMNDSVFVYWHVYYQADGVTGLFEESLLCESRPAVVGTAVKRGIWVIPEGEASPYDHWRNGRGIEHDGWRMWRICLFTNEIYRGRAPVSGTTPVDTLFSMQNLNHWGVYPGYDIDFQAKNAAGGEPHTPYIRGNKFYLWTTNIENPEVFKLDVTNIVLPSQVENVTATRIDANNVKIKWDNKNSSTNPDSVEKVERYIVYRTTGLGLVGDSIGWVTASGAAAPQDSFNDPLPGPWPKLTDYWYRVSAVNWFGFLPGYSNAGGPVVGIEEQITTAHYKFLFYDLAPNITSRRLNLNYEVAEPCAVNLKVYNTLGALVRTLVSKKIKPGQYNLIWDLKDNLKQSLANGVYFVKFSTDKGYERTQKLILVH